MKQTKLQLAAIFAAATLAACTDDNYDLSDLDTLAKVQVTDLVVPANIDPFTLSSILDLDGNDPDEIISVADGKYIISRTGVFNSDEIRFSPVNLLASASHPAHTTLYPEHSGMLPAGITLDFDLSTQPVQISYSSRSIPEEILEIESVEADFTITYSFSIPELEGKVNRMKFTGLQLEFPAGLTGTASAGSYDSTTGIVTVPSASVSAPSFSVSLICTGLDFVKMGGAFNPATHTASFESEMKIKSGQLTISSSDLTGAMPAALTLNSNGALSDIDVTTFTGRVNYRLEGVSVNDIRLNDIPDILAQNDTRLILGNPQLYLSVTNPLAQYGLGARTGLEITSCFGDGDNATTSVAHTLDAPGYFDVTDSPESNYCLAPSDPYNYADGFASPRFVKFSALADVLDGPGIPRLLNVTLTDPQVFNQPVRRLPIGVNLGKVDGRYKFYAPLQLEAGSQIVYTKTENGWSSSDLDAVTIEKLEITATISSDLGFDVMFSGYPVDADGNRINNVEIVGADVPAGARDHKVTIRITGEITRLDGIVFTATGIVPADMPEPLSPSQSISCKDVRAKVSGYYLKEL